MLSSSLLSTLIALAGIFLGLSLFVQVLQEVYKYVTSSKSRSYVNALVDFLGPHAYGLLQPGTLPDLQTRGPFQFLRRRPVGRIQPMDQPELVAALERTAAPWIRRGLEAIRLEATLQDNGKKQVSPAFGAFLRQLEGVERGSPGYTTALELRGFLETWGVDGTESPVDLDAGALVLAFRQRFLPAVVQAETYFAQLGKNVEYAYRRRNLRQTFVIGLLLAIGFQLPFDRLYRQASAVDLEDAATTASALREIYAQAAQDTAAEMGRLRALADTLQGKLLAVNVPLDTPSLSGLRSSFQDWGSAIRYLLGCLVTTLLISFGAPFWNDLAGVLLTLKGGAKPKPQEPATPEQ